MSQTVIPGLKAQHVIISDACIKLHGADGAFNIAVERLKKDYDLSVKGWKGKGAKLHLCFVVQRPGRDEE